MKRRQYIQFLVFALGVLLLSSCGKYRHVYDDVERMSFEHQDRDREYLVHLPKNYSPDKEYPVVFVLHGIISRAKAIAGFSDFNTQADEQGFIVCYPQGVGRSWAIDIPVGPAPKKGIDDVGFISRIIDTLDSQYSIDTSKVFSCGISNGGFMSMRLACEVPEKFAGIALVCSNMFDTTLTWCDPEKAMPVMFIAGTDDPLLPFHGGMLNNGPYRSTGYPKAMRFWCEQNEIEYPCDTIMIDDNPVDETVVVKHYYESENDAPVVLYRVIGGGHGWHGRGEDWKEILIGRLSDEVKATELISDFFMDLVKRESDEASQ